MLFEKMVLKFCATLIILLVVQKKCQFTCRGDDEIEPRIIGGRITSIQHVKYLVQVLHKDELCGGSLVKPRWVMTAAHCVLGANKQELKVYGGASNIAGPFSVFRRVDFMSVNPVFKRKTLNMDVAALRLKQPMVGTNIETIELATTMVPPRSLVQVSGWGLARPNADQPPLRVHTVLIPVWSNFACHRVYHGIQMITKSMMCASKPHARDSCAGDSGGPLVYKGKLAGIVSWGLDCASNYPGVYTIVPVIRDWFLGTVRNNS